MNDQGSQEPANENKFATCTNGFDRKHFVRLASCCYQHRGLLSLINDAERHHCTKRADKKLQRNFESISW